MDSPLRRIGFARAASVILGVGLPGIASAHSFGRLYNLPVPFWMYIYGATAALAVSFLLVAYFLTADVSPSAAEGKAASGRPIASNGRLLQVLRAISVLGLLLCIATGFFGNRDPYANFSMTFFWIVFVLGFAYLTALIGDWYAALNPWATLAEGLNRVVSGFTRGRFHYPVALGYWPALLFYMAFIWIELFAHTRPFSLAVLLTAYSLINLFGVWLIGAAAWFRYGEFFSVFLRLTAKMAPVDFDGSQVRFRKPFAGLLDSRPESYGLLVFVLFMLSSTAFDGLRATIPWVRLFWADPLNLITPLIGQPPVQAYVALRPFYLAYESFWLLASPFIYLGVYLLFIWLAKLIARSDLTVRDLALRFAFTLLPIVLVYNITHYYTLILTQGVKIVSLFSDPFGWGWNLFGTAGRLRAPILPEMGFVWHSQVGLILFGHIVSVYLAHVEALRTFPTRRAATLSQLPMLLLMVLFTGAGLWILAQPLTTGG